MKTIVKLTVATLLAVSAAAPAFAFEPEAQLLTERNMPAVGQNQVYGSYAQDIGASVTTVEPEAQLLAERANQGEAFHAHAEVRSHR